VAPAGVQAVGQILSPAQDAAWLGLSVDDGEDQGAVVRAVEPDSPAADAGIEVGDLLTGLDGARVVGSRQFARIIGETPVGRTVRLTVIRDGQTRELSVTLAARPQPLRFYPIAPNTEAIRSYNSYNDAFRIFSRLSSPDLRLGLRIQEMTPELRTFFGAEPDRGVLVATVVEGSSADESGILVGDVIVAVAGRAIGTPGDLSWSGELVDDRLVLEIVREGVSREISVPLDLPPRSLRIGP
jgi:serine protease Do